MIPILIAEPTSDSLEMLRRLVSDLGTPVTLAWTDLAALEFAAADVVAAGATSLFVNLADEGMGRAALGHQQQVLGPASFVVVVPPATRPASVEPVVRLVLEVLPPSATVVVGDDDGWRVVADVTTSFGLAAPVRCDESQIAVVASELAQAARWETV